ncbi:MAG: metallophosphoesterase, partial [Planctomyces sp.]
MYDIIGDIHGCADELVELLETLGYVQNSAVFRHPQRQVIFCGDFIDRGPQIRDVLNICRDMCQHQAALAVMGNHELNALAYHTPDPSLPGEFLRRHTEHNHRQISQTLQQLSSGELQQALDWFRTLPACLELPELRVVHACWDAVDLQLLQSAAAELGWMTNAYLHQAARCGTQLFHSIERVMKGPEMRFPNGMTLTDREGMVRKRARIRWFDQPAGCSFSDYMFPSLPLPEFTAAPVPGDIS